MLVFDAQNSGCRSLRSSFPSLEHMVCVVSEHQLKEAFKHVLINEWGQKQVPRVDVCKVELFAFPCCICWCCPFLACKPVSTLISQIQSSRQLHYQFCQRSAFQNLIFQLRIKDVYSLHSLGIMWKMYKTCQYCLWAFVFDKKNSSETLNAQKAMDKKPPCSNNFKSRSLCLDCILLFHIDSFRTSIKRGCANPLSSSLPGVAGGTQTPEYVGTYPHRTMRWPRKGRCYRRTWSLHRMLSPSSCRDL